MKRSLSIRAWGLGLAAWIGLATAHAQDVLTQHNDNARTGANLHETHLNASNVNAQHFGKLFERSVDGSIYAQPLYASGVNTASHGVRNVIYVATMHDTVYAFDADDPHASSPLWTASLGPSVPLHDPNIGGGGGYNDISGEVGITSTPVISRAHNAIYVVTLTKIGNVYAHHLHALDLGSGQELFGGPRNIAATVPGTGGGSANGSVSLVNHLQNQRPALLLANDMVYMAFASWATRGRTMAGSWVTAPPACSRCRKRSTRPPTAASAESGKPVRVPPRIPTTTSTSSPATARSAWIRSSEK
ncbi:MAG TPA: hypothetical protein VMH32_23005 [Burkholderiales bacterium]|nr:hypothetical protein [Burkholderiales bacterium]